MRGRARRKVAAHPIYSGMSVVRELPKNHSVCHGEYVRFTCSERRS